jgi:FkbH-like protein
VLATFTTTTLGPGLVVEGAERGLYLRPSFAPFNQLEQWMLDPTSPLYGGAPDVVLLMARLEDLAPVAASRFLARPAAETQAELDGAIDRLAGLLAAFRRHSGATVLVSNFPAPANFAAGLADANLESSQAAAIQRANARLSAVCRETGGVFVLDLAQLVASFGARRWFDPKLWLMARVPFGAEAQGVLTAFLARSLRAALRPAAKCLVLDLDNTLWGGVLGEEGPRGIQLGEDFPGNAFRAFQREALALRDRGILLAVCSKNDEAEALETLEQHPECLLRPGDFAALKINWDDKAANLQAIARDLSIGTDSLAFFDDNPTERDWVRQQMPEVFVIDAPASPSDYARALRECEAFDTYRVSAEDRSRADGYRAAREVEALRARSATVEEFLEELGMVAEIGPVDPATLPRAAQLLAKTNQFNVTTRRHSEGDLLALLSAGGTALWLRLTDRYGDNGIVGLAIAVPDGPEAFQIDSFLLSCRVIGRRAEQALLATLFELLRRRGARRVWGEFLPTKRNSVAADFFPKAGFAPGDMPGRWEWNLDASMPEAPGFIRRSLERLEPAGAEAGRG